MTELLLPEILTRQEASPQADLPLATEGVLHYVWESKFGPMLIEIRQGKAYVNGQAIEPGEPAVRGLPTAEADPL